MTSTLAATSLDAYRQYDRSSMRQQIIALVAQRGDVTIDEASAHFDVAPNRLSGRFRELKDEGILIATALRRKTRSGSSAIVHRLKTIRTQIQEKKNMELHTGKEATFEVVRIEEGMHTATFVEAKKIPDGQHGRRLALTFRVDDKKTLKGNAVELAYIAYYEYPEKDAQKQLTGKYLTAITPNSKITEALEALGWTFEPEAKVNLDSFVGKKVRVMVEDYEKEKNGKKEFRSGISKVKPLVPEATQPTV